MAILSKKASQLLRSLDLMFLLQIINRRSNYEAQVLRSSKIKKFPGFTVSDIKEWSSEQRVEVHLVQNPGVEGKLCHKCRGQLGSYHDQYKVKAKHLKMTGWQVEVLFFREKRFCGICKKTRLNESIGYLHSKYHNSVMPVV